MAWQYIPGSPNLGQTGEVPVFADNTDIAGEARPGADGYYSIGPHEQQYITENLGAAIYSRIILDAGAIYMNFISQDNPGILLGATREGNIFTIEQEIKEIVIDGTKGFVKGSRRFIRSNIKLTCNFIEHTKDLWQIAIPGSETTILPDHISYSRDLVIDDNDYIDNIVIIAQISGSDVPVICGVKNALADGNFEMGSEESNERGLTIEFTAHYDRLNLDNEPFILMYPEELI